MVESEKSAFRLRVLDLGSRGGVIDRSFSWPAGCLTSAIPDGEGALPSRALPASSMMAVECSILMKGGDGALARRNGLSNYEL